MNSEHCAVVQELNDSGTGHLIGLLDSLDQVKKKSEGLSVFIVDLRQAVGNGLTVKPIRNMANQETNETTSDTMFRP